MQYRERLAGLTLRDSVLLLRALGWLIAVRITLPLLGLAPLQRHIEALGRGPKRASLDPLRAVWAIGAMANRLPGTGCLARALALQALLRTAGLNSKIRLGVAIGEGAMRAHAWVDLEGETLPAGADERYGVLAAPRA